jgi:propionyl-CoA carboxylase alpha chain
VASASSGCDAAVVTPIRSLLVANRGEIARRIFRTAREMGISTVAVFSDPDAQAPFVQEADAAVRLPGATPAETYLRIDALMQAAKRSGADAVHPGYGFLSENADFAQAVLDAGLIWVGPPPAAIEAMGSKLGAKRMMRESGVPTLAWVESPDDAGEVGYPLLVKASAGGGGRGMRVVRRAPELSDAVQAARREAGGAFGDDTVFLERYLEAPRHIEIQVFADTHGNVVSLFERECSIQRRHQKIVEEAPSPVVTAELRERMGQAAVAAAKAVGYVGAGTVEFVVDGDLQFSFLEMNTRLQVEHPVTELVTGLDLVRLQLLVAQGEPLPPEALAPELSGHAIEVRLYAEDARAGFLPSTGTLRAFEVERSVRLDSGVESGGVVSPFYDPMLAKVIAHAPTRAEAARRLSTALRRSRIHGVTTNRDLLVRILEHDEFLDGGTDTAFLERHDPAALAASLLDEAGRDLHLTCAALALQADNRDRARVWARLPSGWRNNPSQPQRVELSTDGRPTIVTYAIGRHGVSLAIDDRPLDLTLHAATPGQLDISIDGVRRDVSVAIHGELVDVDSALGSSTHVVLPRFPDPTHATAAGSLLAPMPGSVVRVLVDVGAVVASGQPLVVLEAMKMEHTVSAPSAGSVSDVRVTPGQQVESGAVLVVVVEPAVEADEEQTDAN